MWKRREANSRRFIFDKVQVRACRALRVVMHGFAASPVVGLPQDGTVFVDGAPMNEPGAGEVSFDGPVAFSASCAPRGAIQPPALQLAAWNSPQTCRGKPLKPALRNDFGVCRNVHNRKP